VRHRPLQRQHRRQQVRVRRVGHGLRAVHEPQVVVAVRDLSLAARVDHVRLRGDLVARPQPGRADQGEHVVAVVVGEHLRSPAGELVQRAPDPVVGAGRGEVVTRDRPGRVLLGDDGREHLTGPVHHLRVERRREHHDARAVQQRPGQLGRQFPPPGAGCRLFGRLASVDRHIFFNNVGTGILTQVGDLLDFGPEVIEAAVFGGVPAAGRGRR
jgi:hypothetical protein